MTRTDSQKKLIRAHLMTGGTITPLEALREFGCYRLGARISELRSEGLNISTTMEESISNITGKPVRFARYSLTSKERPNL